MVVVVVCAAPPFPALSWPSFPLGNFCLFIPPLIQYQSCSNLKANLCGFSYGNSYYRIGIKTSPSRDSLFPSLSLSLDFSLFLSLFLSISLLDGSIVMCASIPKLGFSLSLYLYFKFFKSYIYSSSCHVCPQSSLLFQGFPTSITLEWDTSSMV